VALTDSTVAFTHCADPKCQASQPRAHRGPLGDGIHTGTIAERSIETLRDSLPQTFRPGSGVNNTCAPTKLRLFQAIPKDMHVFECESGANGDAGQWIICYITRNTGHLCQEVGKVPEHRATTGQDHSLVNNVG